MLTDATRGLQGADNVLVSQLTRRLQMMHLMERNKINARLQQAGHEHVSKRRRYWRADGFASTQCDSIHMSFVGSLQFSLGVCYADREQHYAKLLLEHMEQGNYTRVVSLIFEILTGRS